MTSYKERCPICNSHLESAVALVGEKKELKILKVCSNHRYLGKRMPISFSDETDMKNLDKLINEIKKGNLTCIRNNVGYQAFLKEKNIIF